MPRPIIVTPSHASIGKIVHFVAPTGRHTPGVILEVYPNGTVDLVTFRPTAYKMEVRQDPDAAKGTWHWPERGE